MDIDQTGIIEQLTAENAALRGVLRKSPDKEIQIAAALTMVMDELTRMGPQATARVVNWTFLRYGIDRELYARQVPDRRPKPAPAPPKQEPPTPPAPIVKKLERRHALRQARVPAGLTQTALAERAGIAASRISQIELGNTKPTEATWGRLEEAVAL